MFEDQFRYTCTREVNHSGKHGMEHEGQVIEWEDYAEPRIRVPKPPVIIMPRRVEGGREEFWRQLGQENYFNAYMRHNGDLPFSKWTGLPDGSTWVDHMWKLTPGTKLYDHTDTWTVLMVAETPVSVIVWTSERMDSPFVYGGDRLGRGSHGHGPRSIEFGKREILWASKSVAERKGESFKGTYADEFVPLMGSRS